MHRLFHLLLITVLLSTVFSIAINNQTNDTYQVLEQDKQDFSSIPKIDKIDEFYPYDYYQDSLSEYNTELGGINEGEQDASNQTTNSTMTDNNYIYNQNAVHKKCPMCRIRDEQRRNRIETIKRRISHALEFDVFGMPNTTQKRIPKVPSFQRLREKYENLEMQSDSPNRRKEERLRYQDTQEEYGQPERTYTFAKELPNTITHGLANSVFFDMPLTPKQEAIKALLWVYISEEDIIGRNMTEIHVYTIDPPGKSGKAFSKREIGRRKRHYMKAAGWHHFNILDEVKKWTYKNHRNLGLIVEALDEQGRNMVVLPPTSSLNDGFEPLLDIRTSLRRNQRSKRGLELYCDEDVEEIACCRYPLEVDFVQFGWDFVIAPLKYAAYYCAGECKGEEMDGTIHAQVFQQGPPPTLSQPQSVLSNIGPCCTPTRMSALSMLFFDHASNVQYITLPRMKVDRCGCA